MAVINAEIIKTLRDRTGIGMMDCKNALKASNGDIELAIDNLRKSGQIKAAKKSGRATAEGIVIGKVSNDQRFGLLLEVNCETDFVAKDSNLIQFAQEALEYAFINRIEDITVLKEHFEEKRTDLVLKLGENINLRRFKLMTAEMVSFYRHGSQIGVLVASTKGDAGLLKQVAMHIAASRPEYIQETDIPLNVIEHEKEIQRATMQKTDKPAAVLEKIMMGKLQKFCDDVSLLKQAFIVDTNKKVGQVLEEHGITIEQFTYYKAGEGIEKIQHNFAEEVAALSQGLDK